MVRSEIGIEIHAFLVFTEKKEAPPRPPAPNVPPAVVDGSKTLPYPSAFPRGMPLPYNVTGAFAYPPPPMPTSYNPYATLPQMHGKFIIPRNFK